MDFYLTLISISRQFPGGVFVVVSVIHGILVVGIGVPTQPCGLVSEYGQEPGVHSPLVSVV